MQESGRSVHLPEAYNLVDEVSRLERIGLSWEEANDLVTLRSMNGKSLSEEQLVKLQQLESKAEEFENRINALIQNGLNLSQARSLIQLWEKEDRGEDLNNEEKREKFRLQKLALSGARERVSKKKKK